MSAADRAHTIQVAINREAEPGDLVQPGHVFPLRARPFGVLERTGQTEASVDLARLAGLQPAGVICEIMNEDGSMARVHDLVGYCGRHGLTMITVADLVAYRRRNEKLVERIAAASMPTRYGEFVAYGYRSMIDGQQHVAHRDGRCRRRPRTCWCACTRSASPAMCSTRCAATAASSSTVRSPQIAAEGAGRAAVPVPGGPRHRPAEQAAGLRAAGAGARHRRRQPGPRSARRLARLRRRAIRSWRTSGSRRCASSPTTRRRSSASRATGSRSPSSSRSRRSRTP